MSSDYTLLQEFRKHRSEASFRELVDRHLGLVHSVAQRVTRNEELAKDVSQIVFAKLAQAPPMRSEVNFLAWLHRTTRHAAIDLIRSENRRRRRESVAHETMSTEPSSPLWSQIEPLLDDVLNMLPEKERRLILARYYQSQSHSTTAQQLGISEDAARVRTARALNRLRKLFARKGIQTTAALLGTSLTSRAVTPVSNLLVNEVCSASFTLQSAGAWVTSAAGLKPFLPSVIFLSIATPLTLAQFQKTTRLESEIQNLQSLESSQPIEQESLITREPSPQPQVISEEVLAIQERSRQFDTLLKLYQETGRDLLPFGAFTKDFEPTKGLNGIFSLSPTQTSELTALGQGTLSEIKKWEIKNAVRDKPRDDKYQYAFKIPSGDQHMASIRENFRLRVQEILGNDNYSLISGSLMSEFLAEGEDYLISFQLEEDSKGRTRFNLKSAQLDSRGRLRGGSARRGSPLVAEDRTGRRFSHLFDLVSLK